MLTRWEAVEKRISCRGYQEKPVSAEIITQLQAYIAELNQESGLNFQLFAAEDGKTSVVSLASAMFKGTITVCAALPGGEDPISSEKVGYYGQKLVIMAEQLGLGTCWVGGTYDKKSINVVCREGEKVWDVIPMGYALPSMPVKQKMIRAAIRKTDRKLEQFLEADMPFSQTPDWVQKGIEAVKLGPSAVNQQPVNIVYKEGKVSMRIWKDGKGFQYNDMGIAKYQFEIGAAQCGVKGTWEFGDGGAFLVQE